MAKETIELKQVTESDKKILIKDRGCRVTFDDDFIHTHSEAVWKVYNEALGYLEEKQYYNDWRTPRGFIGEIELYYWNYGDKWVVTFGEHSYVFEEQREAEGFYNKVWQWRFGRK